MISGVASGIFVTYLFSAGRTRDAEAASNWYFDLPRLEITHVLPVGAFEAMLAGEGGAVSIAVDNVA